MKKKKRSFAKRLRERQLAELSADMLAFDAGREYHEDPESFRGSPIDKETKETLEAFERFYLKMLKK